jgi:hypothetical protein
MPGRHQLRPLQRAGVRWLAGGVTLAVAGIATGAALVAGPATAAPKPNPNYHPGSDTATFTVTGVLDSNCLISAGGTEVWIKPGDVINFNSALVGINVAALTLNGVLGTVAALNVDASIDGGTAHAISVPVRGTKAVPVPKAGQPALTAGDHKLTWHATSVSLVGGLVTLPLSNGDLQTGADLSWSGTIHVTDGAPNCKIGVSTPNVGVSAGPVKVPTVVPPVNVKVPVALPPKPPAGGDNPPPGGGDNGPPPTHISYTPPPVTVPEEVVGGLGAGHGVRGVQPDSGDSTQLGTDLSNGSVAAHPGAQPSTSSSAGQSKTVTRSVNYTSNKAPAAQLPVILAIIAIIALAMVTATYARLYLLRRDVV